MTSIFSNRQLARLFQPKLIREKTFIRLLYQFPFQWALLVFPSSDMDNRLLGRLKRIFATKSLYIRSAYHVSDCYMISIGYLQEPP